MTDDTSAFDQIVKTLEYPMFVIAAAADGDVGACLVGFTSQCSIEPSRFAVFLSKANHTWRVAGAASVLVVHRLRDDQHELAEHFGGTSAYDDPDKLAEWPWTPGPDGAPVIDGCDWFAGRIVERLDAGDHEAFVLEPFAGECRVIDQLDSQEAFDIEAGRPVD
jgi:flavin reductase (DIM6/NTAB) family NADH-FMN oxidoreductase RutF